MRRILQFAALCLSAAVVNACKQTEVFTNPDAPTAGVRFINAVPDTGATYGLDFRFVDIVENSDAFRIGFRNNPQSSAGVTASAGIQFKAAAAGSRHYKIFLDDTLQAVASTALFDGTTTLTAGHNYTFLIWGKARSAGSDKMNLQILDENVADPGNNVALRVINATGSAIDVRNYLSTGTAPTACAAPACWSNIGAYQISSYVTVAPNTYKFNVQPTGGGTALFTDLQAIPGQPVGTSTNGCTVGLDCDVTPGTLVPGSAVTLIVFPASVAGSKAVNFTTPGGSFMWDRRPARQCTVSFGC